MKLDLKMSKADFLQNYWQKQPKVFKNALLDFVEPCSADELAGLATEDSVESRVIFQNKQGWQVAQGPFDDFNQWGEKKWTLVVQSVNHFLKPVDDFAKLFDFIPAWRFDDVMVSFASPEGGVGPHMDAYDVFICQGSGQRRWRVGARGADEFLAHEKLRHVKPFEAIIDEVLSAGDVLYIPAGFAHEGVSLDASMSFSVGYKATHAIELLSGFADYLIDFETKNILLDDKRQAPSRYASIDMADFTKLQDLILSLCQDKARFAEFLGCYQSTSRAPLDLLMIEEEALSFTQFKQQFREKPLYKLFALKALYLDANKADGVFYVDGERVCLPISGETVMLLCESECLYADQLPADTHLWQWLYEMVKRGYWYFDE